MVQSAVATMASLSMDMKMELIHEPLLSGNSTADREAWLVVNSSYTVGTGDGSPRLYYSVDGSGFTALQPASTNLDTFFFMIPGQVMGSTVEYYLAAQNEDATLVATLPEGGKGIDPPGSIAPESFFSYMVDDIYAISDCSQTTPKNIDDLNHLYDTITIDHTGTLVDVNVSLDITHTYCGDVEISLIGPDGTEVDLSIGNGGSGNNFTGTIFDDDASTPISAGSAPFTGSYQPDQPLSTLSGKSINGNWVLHIYDNALNDQGVLLNWCVDMLYSGDPVSIPKQQKTLLTVYQNYPNPFRENTTFSFDLEASGSVKISVLDMLGRSLTTVTEREYEAGSHTVRWNASSLTAGQYFYKVQTDENVAVKPMLIIK